MSCGCRTSRSGSASVLSAARSPSSFLIPGPLRLGRARPNYFLVLSNSCSTCQTIGSGLAASASRWESAITVLVASDSEKHGQEWASSVGLDSPRVFIDDQGKYAKQLGVSSSPTVVRVERGRLTAAANLTSLRQLEVFVDGFATN